jgi:hypothetical protein
MDPAPAQLDVLLDSVGRSSQELSCKEAVSRRGLPFPFAFTFAISFVFAFELLNFCSSRNSKNASALEERNNLFSQDADIRKFDAERLLCNRCVLWCFPAFLLFPSSCAPSCRTFSYALDPFSSL